MALPTDPLLGSQWHLKNNVAGLLDLNVFGVWNPTEGPAYTGAGTRTVVIDDGFDYLHPDFDNYNQGLDFDFDQSDLDPFGGASDAHGTAVAGIIGAAADGAGAVGVAFGTQLVGYRTNGFISDFWLQNIRDAIFHAAVSAQGDVANISQGIANDTSSEFGAGYNPVRFDEIEASIGTAVNTGRGGLGMTIVKSAGNSRSANYDVNVDDWTNDTRQVVVSAVDQNGFVSFYSSYGAALLVSGFGTPGQVVTTDRQGAAGYTGGDFTSGFNGTSAAAPMVAGVVGLMYDAEAGLGWRDVQNILGASARHVGSAVGGGTAGSERYAWGFNAAGTWNGGGQHFSNDYGYGLVDARAAVRMAESWFLTGAPAATTSNEFENVMDVLNANTLITPGAAGVTFSGNAGFDDIVERVTVQMSFATTWLGDVEVYVISPDGTVSELANAQAGSADFNGTWTFESQAFRGERAAGTWSVRVVDTVSLDALTVSDIVITTWGAFTSNDRYVYTDEYNTYAGTFGHSTIVTDGNGGIDTVNASAVTTNSSIFLDGSSGTIAGRAAAFNNIENAIGGDGNDFIVGNAGANQLFGMRGADTLKGGGGSDLLDGGTGNDNLVGGGGEDTLIGGLGNDTLSDGATLLGGDGNDLLFSRLGTDSIDGGAGVDTLDTTTFTGNYAVNLATGLTNFGGETFLNIENLVTGDGADTLTGSAFNNSINGGAGNDAIDGNGGQDTLIGGLGNDTLREGATLLGGDGDDLLFSRLGTDSIDGGAGVDTLDTTTFNGNYAVNLTTGLSNFGGETFANFENLITGGGNDTLTGTAGANNIQSGAGNDVIDGGADNDTLFGLTGNDFLSGGAGNDSLIGGNTDLNAEFDTLDGGAGVDTMLGGDGNDLYIVDNTADVTAGEINDSIGGDDTVQASATYTLAAAIERLVQTGLANIDGTGNALANTMTGNGGNNLLRGLTGNDTINGGAGKDTLEGGDGDDSMSGGAGNDRMFGEAGNDILQNAEGRGTLVGGDGDDTLIGGTGEDLLDGGTGNDTMTGGDGVDTLVGGGGNDSMDGGVNRDNLLGGNGADLLFGGGSDDTLDGGEGADTLNGDGGQDLLIGGTQNDTLNGGSGNDTLRGGLGNDTVTGGLGIDTFIFEDGVAGTHDLRITDFNIGQGDRIGFDAINIVGGGGTILSLAQLDTTADGFVTAADNRWSLVGGSLTFDGAQGDLTIAGVVSVAIGGFFIV